MPRFKKATPVEVPVQAAPAPAPQQTSVDALAAALVQAINITKPTEKKTAVNRKINTPWSPKDGSPRLKLKRQSHQHGVLMDPEFLSNEEIALLNQLRPGLYMDGYVKVIRRKDRGIDISYPVKTASQRLRLIHQYGIRNLRELCERCIEEAANPTKRDQVDADGDFV